MYRIITSQLLCLLMIMCAATGDLPEVSSSIDNQKEIGEEGDIENSAIQISTSNLQDLEKFLVSTILEDPWSERDNPLVYFELDPGVDNGVSKRSRYYRKYPWKRVSRNKNHWENEAYRYLCSPSRDDLVSLLVAIHEAREGDSRKTVRFCNRKRPASTIFTNIRFIGKK